MFHSDDDVVLEARERKFQKGSLNLILLFLKLYDIRAIIHLQTYTYICFIDVCAIHYLQQCDIPNFSKV